MHSCWRGWILHEQWVHGLESSMHIRQWQSCVGLKVPPLRDTSWFSSRCGYPNQDSTSHCRACSMELGSIYQRDLAIWRPSWSETRWGLSDKPDRSTASWWIPWLLLWVQVWRKGPQGVQHVPTVIHALFDLRSMPSPKASQGLAAPLKLQELLPKRCPSIDDNKSSTKLFY